jgi:hypothetical protein
MWAALWDAVTLSIATYFGLLIVAANVPVPPELGYVDEVPTPEALLAATWPSLHLHSAVYAASGIVSTLLYFPLLWATNGATLWQREQRLVVTDSSGARLSIGPALRRWLALVGPAIVAIGLATPLGRFAPAAYVAAGTYYVWLIATAHSDRALHDRIAGSYVRQENVPEAQPR